MPTRRGVEEILGGERIVEHICYESRGEEYWGKGLSRDATGGWIEEEYIGRNYGLVLKAYGNALL